MTTGLLKKIDNQSSKRMLSIAGRSIRKIRKGKGISQRELAIMAGCTRANIGMVENGNHNVSVHLLLAICQILGCEVEEIFTRRCVATLFKEK